MIAMVMCAGEGTRLKPLTYLLPKPMVPIANRPVLEYTLLNLKKHGIREVIINLSYKPEMIQSYFKNGSRLGLHIHYSIEKKMLGTAGGVKNVEHLFDKSNDSDILITSGDSLTDFNFTRFIQYHKKKNAFCTIATKRVDTRFEYGIPLLNRRNKIEKFVEKPSWSDVFSNRVNCGIYLFKKNVLKLIPKNRFYDFGKQLFPRLLNQKAPMFAFEIKEFWTDIGNLMEYRRAQKVVLDKKVSFRPEGKEVKPCVWIGERTKIAPHVQLEAPCAVGNDCILEKNATIGAYAVIGNGSKIGAGSILKDTVLWEGAEIGEGVVLTGSIAAQKEKVAAGLSIFDGTILRA